VPRETPKASSSPVAPRTPAPPRVRSRSAVLAIVARTALVPGLIRSHRSAAGGPCLRRITITITAATTLPERRAARKGGTAGWAVRFDRLDKERPKPLQPFDSVASSAPTSSPPCRSLCRGRRRVLHLVDNVVQSRRDLPPRAAQRTVSASLTPNPLAP
jgi:hypothetical protein